MKKLWTDEEQRLADRAAARERVPAWYAERFTAEAMRQNAAMTATCVRCGIRITGDNYAPCSCDVHRGMCGNCVWRNLA